MWKENHIKGGEGGKEGVGGGGVGGEEGGGGGEGVVLEV